MNKYDLKTKQIEREITKLKSIVEPLREKAKTSHHRIDVSEIKLKTSKGIKTFKSMKSLGDYVKRQEKIIKTRKFKASERETRKKITKETNEALKKMEREAKKLEREAKNLKEGKRKASKLEKAKSLRESTSEYKRIKAQNKKAGKTTAGLKKTKTKETIQRIVGRERANAFADNMWGLWELALGGDPYYNTARDILYKLAQDGILPMADITNLSNMFDTWYMYMKTDPLMADNILNDIKIEIDNLLEKYAYDEYEDMKTDEGQWS